jgi:lysine N6-hydroxylase
MTRDALDLAGIGIGPFNLSLAAQLDGIAGVTARFFERQPRFDWHPGMMLPGVTLQTSFLKDLVTATNPTSPWSFIAYLVAHKRFYDFVNAAFDAIPRQEFANYLAWVAEALPSLAFDAPVREIGFDGEAFVLRLDTDTIRASDLALGVGRRQAIPALAEALVGPSCFHASEMSHHLGDVAGQRVAVIGGGQSGAEIVQYLLERDVEGPSAVRWISRRPNFRPLDDSPFTNELFTPDYVERFHALPEQRRRSGVTRDKLAGDGISPATLAAIYRRLYALRHLTPEPLDTALLPHREVLSLARDGGSYRLVMRNGFDGQIEIAHADIVVLATGYVAALPECLAPIADRFARDGEGGLRLAADFAVQWSGPERNRIFALNAGLVSHGIAEPQLSLMAWRSAVIANALLRRPHFDIAVPPPVVSWTAGNTRPHVAQM